MVRRLAIFVFGAFSYAVFFATFLYSTGFIGNFAVPRTLDGTPSESFATGLLVNLGLLGVFAVQHSVMARPAFKRWFTKLIPETVERSAYVLLSSFALIALFTFWEPLGGVVWAVTDPTLRGVLWGAFVFGWLLVLVSTFLINHFDLFGLRQVWLQLVDRPYSPLEFRTPGPYLFVRHPLYLGWLFAFWATPTMTISHLVFAIATTGYILVAIRFEERDLVAHHGKVYQEYVEKVPMLVPFTLKRNVDEAFLRRQRG